MWSYLRNVVFVLIYHEMKRVLNGSLIYIRNLICLGPIFSKWKELRHLLYEKYLVNKVHVRIKEHI